jgi:hypothetical protein
MRACWYKEEEYFKMAIDCLDQANRMKRGDRLKDKKYCSRGLESYTNLAAISRRQNRKLATNAVLHEQEGQRLMGFFDDETIAEKYFRTASSCQLWARTVGLRDKRAVEGYMMN